MLRLFKVGDRVRVTESEECCNGYNPIMRRYKNKITEITSVESNTKIKLAIDDGYFTWCYKTIEPLSRRPAYWLGDKVKIVKKDSSDVIVTDEMRCRYFGKTTTIVGFGYDHVRLKIDNGYYSWGFDMIKKIHAEILDNE